MGEKSVNCPFGILKRSSYPRNLGQSFAPEATTGVGGPLLVVVLKGEKLVNCSMGVKGPNYPGILVLLRHLWQQQGSLYLVMVCMGEELVNPKKYGICTIGAGLLVVPFAQRNEGFKNVKN
jgi:hypothetical protein